VKTRRTSGSARHRRLAALAPFVSVTGQKPQDDALREETQRENLMSSRQTLAFAAALTAIPLLAGQSPARADGPLDAYLPKSGTIQGHVMRLAVAPEDQAIDRQFRNAVANNMDWFKKYVTGNKSGQPLPYNPKMGVTPAQYEKLQHMKADFQPGEAVTIAVKKTADGGVTFASTDKAAAGLDTVTFPADEKAAVTPYGSLSIFNAIHQNDPNAPIGVWNGAEWAQVKPSDADEPSAKIAFGKRDPSGEGVMYYQVAPYKDHAQQSLVVFYKLD
jgi:hypothetical protein